MLDYMSLSALGAVLREGSFDRAARVMGCTPSAISQRIRGLEERVGAMLVVREKPCRATPLGHTLVAHLERVRLMEGELAPALSGAGALQTIRIAVNADSLATWFPEALARFAEAADATVDLVIEDEAHTADRLRSGEVMAAVTAQAEPVHGCRTLALGPIRYAACASPAFVARYFSRGVTAPALMRAPSLRFDRRDGLQARWAREALGCEGQGPTHWVPTTQGFVDLALAGLGWGIHPISLAEPLLADGRLIELDPGYRVDVTLHWTVPRLHLGVLKVLTDAVQAVAARRLS